MVIIKKKNKEIRVVVWFHVVHVVAVQSTLGMERNARECGMRNTVWCLWQSEGKKIIVCWCWTGSIVPMSVIHKYVDPKLIVSESASNTCQTENSSDC